MRYIVYAVATTTALFAGGMLMSGRAEAAPLAPNGLRAAADGLDIIENAQFRLRGRNYCWYEGGWQGPGFYWCGYGSRHGFGWGGGQGWQGWRGGSRAGRDGDVHRGSQFRGEGQFRRQGEGRGQFQRQGEDRGQFQRQGDGKRNGQFQRGSQIKGDGERGSGTQRSGEVQGGDGRRSVR